MRRSRRSSTRPTGPPGADSATPSSSPCSTTPAPASPRSPVCTSPTCFSIGRPPCFCTGRDARSVSSRSGRAPQRNSGGGSPESIEAPTLRCFPIAQASPCRAPGSNINCALPAERPRTVTPRSRRDGSRPTRCATTAVPFAVCRLVLVPAWLLIFAASPDDYAVALSGYHISACVHLPSVRGHSAGLLRTGGGGTAGHETGAGTGMASSSPPLRGSPGTCIHVGRLWMAQSRPARRWSTGCS